MTLEQIAGCAQCAVRSALGLACFCVTFAVPTFAAAAVEPQVDFDDPLLQVTRAIADCPPHDRRKVTQEQMRTEAHSRVERGTRCYQSGRCRLPNAYMYDQEIIPRVNKAILADGRFSETSLWIEGQRRWVWLSGCVRTRAQAVALERLVRSIDDVESVINELTVKPR